jgi:transcriptional regulator with GAF, ATPase, and Fis domain
LFGHERGAFTGAITRRRGRFEQAHGGTLFLDEIGELGIDLQAKLLRVLQTKCFERVGGEENLSVDVRVVAATNRDLKALVVEGEFREDLFYRLDVVPIELPPLRERKEDIPLLAEHILRQLSRQHGWAGLALAPDAIEELSRRPWPGNVRELRNVLARAAILARGSVIRATDLSIEDRSGMSPLTKATGTLQLRVALAETEERVIRQALEQTNWNRTQAARVLGISRRQLFDKIRLYGLHN